MTMANETKSQPPELHVFAARLIVAAWVQTMLVNPEYRKGDTIRDWLLRCREDSSAMHDNTDANEIFAEVLETLGLIKQATEDELRAGKPILNERDTAIWNAVTNDHGLLEQMAEEFLDALG